MFSDWMTRNALRIARLGWATTNVIVGGVIPALLISDFSSAQSSRELRLCPATIVNTCYIGYVISGHEVVVLISSMDGDHLFGGEAEVDASPPGYAIEFFDLSPQIGSVVMLDATGQDRLYTAKLVSVADPLLTALYMSGYLLPPTGGATPQ
jgi:hypothetical protein